MSELLPIPSLCRQICEQNEPPTLKNLSRPAFERPNSERQAVEGNGFLSNVDGENEGDAG